ncbi:MAG: ATP-dependent DNA helicase, partial [bacterium]
LNISPIDVSETLKENLYQQSQRLIMTSATLTVNNDFQYFTNRLGLVEPVLLGLPHSFDYRSQAILYIPPRLPEPSQADFLPRAAEEIIQILEQTRGRAFVLFTSLKSLDTVHSLLQNRLDYLLLKQGEASKQALLEKFREDEHSVLLGAASFWEGVDVQGTALSCVILEKLPFASPGEPLVQARIDYLRGQEKNPFMEYQIPAAVLNLKQGLGRLIRSHNDRGVLSILDIRLYTKRYGRLFLKSLPPCRISREIKEVEDFLKPGVAL